MNTTLSPVTVQRFVAFQCELIGLPTGRFPSRHSRKKTVYNAADLSYRLGALFLMEDRRRRKLDAERMKQLEHRVIAWFGARRECLVKTLAAQTGVFRQLRHATSTSHITHSG